MPVYQVGSPGSRMGFSALADALAPDPDSEMRAAYYKQQSLKTGMEIERMNRQAAAAQSNQDMLTKMGPYGLMNDQKAFNTYAGNTIGSADYDNPTDITKGMAALFGQDPEAFRHAQGLPAMTGQVPNMAVAQTGAGMGMAPGMGVPGQPGMGPSMPGQAGFQVASLDPQFAQARAPYEGLINAESKRWGVDPMLAMKVAEVESNFNPNAMSPKGYGGLFQMGEAAGKDTDSNIHGVEGNVRGGVGYLHQNLNQFGGDPVKALAAYNWGPGNLSKNGLAAAPPETRQYIDKILGPGTWQRAAAGGSAAPAAPDGSPMQQVSYTPPMGDPAQAQGMSLSQNPYKVHWEPGPNGVPKNMGVARHVRGLDRIDPGIYEAVKQAAQYWPGRVEIISVGRGQGDKGNHSSGHAVDIQLYDENNRPINNYQHNGKGARIYEKFYQIGVALASEKYPHMANARWGGNFRDGSDAADYMHLDTTPNRGTLGGNLRDGATPAMLQLHGGETEAIPGGDWNNFRNMIRGVPGQAPAQGGMMPVGMTQTGGAMGGMGGPIQRQAQFGPVSSSAIPAGITDPRLERMLYTAGGEPHAKDTFTGMQMGQITDLEKAQINEMMDGNLGGSGAGGGMGGGLGPFAGKSMDAQAANIVNSYNTRRDQNIPSSAEEERLYAMAHAQLYGEKVEMRQDAHGNLISVPVRPPVPMGVRSPGASGMGVSPRQAPVPGPTPGPSAGGGGTVIAPGKTPMEGLSGDETRRLDLTTRQMGGIADAFGLYGYDPSTQRMKPGGYRPNLRTLMAESVRDGAGPLRNAIGGAMMSEQDRHAELLFQTVINPLLRLDSGAATPENEVRRYAQSLPTFNDDETTALRKMQNLETLFRQTAAFAQAKGIPIEDLLRQAAANPEQANMLKREFDAMRGGPRAAPAPMSTGHAEGPGEPEDDGDYDDSPGEATVNPQVQKILDRYGIK